MKIFTVRHGQTDWNIERRLQGQTDISLNAEGLAQAEKVAKRQPLIAYTHFWKT